jgi:uncharacterized OB-fold protein
MEQKVDLLEMPGIWDLPWVYAAGEIGSKYIAELRDNARLMATKCPECGRVLLPPRSFCERCFISLKGHCIELEPSGTLEAFTIVTVPFPGEREPPYIVGYFKIGGASTNLPHFLEGVDLSDIERAKSQIWVGMPVKVVFKEQRVGSMTDFYIEPL